VSEVTAVLLAMDGGRRDDEPDPGGRARSL